MSILAIIPARGGSKGLPGKNIRPLLGKPLMAWSIEQALASKYIDHVYVSTDSEEIAVIARSYGALIPFMRPKELAKDATSTADVLIHFIKEIEGLGKKYDHILVLEPTSPLRETQDIDQAYERLLANPDARSIVGVGVVESQHPSFCVSLTNEGFLRSKNDFIVLRRQDIEPLYYYEGSVYLSDISTFKEKKNFYHNQTLGYVFPKWKALEIDDLVDFINAETLLTNKKNL
jgi:CMP-N,N'-diacetyllegionaminic acid synthase|tara:strand:+ start:2409 stop:3104 length:696 start_codon:yes stop_codon:yes gene_type:complete